MALGAGLLAGIALDVLTVLVARYGPSGSGWSFLGNGALVVPFGLGPAVLAGAWTALVVHDRSAARWLPWGVAAGLVSAILVLASSAVVILFDRAGAGLSQGLFLVDLAWMVMAPVLTGMLRVIHRPGERRLVRHVVAGECFRSCSWPDAPALRPCCHRDPETKPGRDRPPAGEGLDGAVLTALAARGGR